VYRYGLITVADGSHFLWIVALVLPPMQCRGIPVLLQ